MVATKIRGWASLTTGILFTLIFVGCATTQQVNQQSSIDQKNETEQTITVQSSAIPNNQQDPVMSNPVEVDTAQLRLLHSKINLQRNSKNLSCPGLGLVLTCGDGKCDANKGENVDSCAADCLTASVRSYNQQTLCTEGVRVFKPKNQDELLQVVQTALDRGDQIKAIGNSHSASGIMCGGETVLDMSEMNQIHGLTTINGEEAVAVDAGAKLFNVAEWLHERNRSVGFTIMGFRWVTVGGAIGTGSHGSSSKHRSVISNRVVGVDIIDGNGQLRQLREDNKGDQLSLKAARAHLGALGVVSRVYLKTEAQFNLDIKVTYGKEKNLFINGGALGLVKDCDYGQMNWYPGTKRYVRVCGKKTTKPAEAGATNSLLNPSLPKWIVKPFKEFLQLGACYNGIMCLMDNFRYAQIRTQSYFVKEKKGKLKPTWNVVGPSHRMMSSVLTPFQEGFFQMDWEIAVPAKHAEAALKDVRDLIVKNKVCLPLVGVFLRFGIAEDRTSMAYTSAGGSFDAGEPVMFIEMPVYLPVGFNAARKAAYDKPFEDFARTMVEKYKARAHVGKNRDWILDVQNAVGNYSPEQKAEFQTVMADFDPKGFFKNEFIERLGL